MTLDDFMRALWERQAGRDGTPGYVETPYTINDLKSAFAAVAMTPHSPRTSSTGTSTAARWWTSRRLLAKAGFMLRRRAAGRAWAGPLQTGTADGCTRDVRHALR